MEDRKEGVRVIIGGDFNAREGGRVEMEEGGEKEKEEERKNQEIKL